MLGRYDRALRARHPVGGQTLLARAIAAIRRNNGALFYVPANFAGSWTDSAGTDPVDAVADVIGRMTDRTGGTGVAAQANLAYRPTVQTNAQGRHVVRFDGSNDGLTTNSTTGNEGWVCAGVTFTTNPDAYEAIFYAGSPYVDKKSVYLVKGNQWYNGRKIAMAISDGTTRYSLSSPQTVTAGVPLVADCGWETTQRFVAVNGNETVETGTNTYGPSAGVAQIGSHFSTNVLNGHMTAQVICPVLPSAADRAIIRKWIASLQGQSL